MIGYNDNVWVLHKEIMCIKLMNYYDSNYMKRSRKHISWRDQFWKWTVKLSCKYASVMLIRIVLKTSIKITRKYVTHCSH